MAPYCMPLCHVLLQGGTANSFFPHLTVATSALQTSGLAERNLKDTLAYWEVYSGVVVGRVLHESNENRPGLGMLHTVLALVIAQLTIYQAIYQDSSAQAAQACSRPVFFVYCVYVLFSLTVSIY